MQPVVNVFIEKMRETRGNRQKAASLSAQSFSNDDYDDDVEYFNNNRGFPHLGMRVVQGDTSRCSLGSVDMKTKVAF